jgi:CBS domain containing-hemolysin-like protein
MTDLLIALFFLLLTGFFAGSETALLASNRIKIKALAAENYLPAKAAYKVRSALSKTIAVILVGTNISVVACSILVTRLFMKNAPSLTILAPFITAIVILLFGEIIPKSLCLRRPNSFTLWFSLPLLGAEYLLRPLATGIHGLAQAMLRRVGVQPQTEALTRRELEIAMKEGGIGFRERIIISGVFDFASKPVCKVMVPRVDMKCIEVNAPVQAILNLAQTSGYSRYPIYEEEIDHIVGVLHVNDLLRMEDDDWKGCMNQAVFIPERRTCSSVLSELRRRRVHMAIVLDEYGGTAGIVTIEDLLEELVGEIEDEYDWKRKRPHNRRI